MADATPQTTSAELSRMLWNARETITMFADIVERRTGRTDTQNRDLVKRIDAYRAERGWDPHGFGDEERDKLFFEMPTGRQAIIHGDYVTMRVVEWRRITNELQLLRTLEGQLEQAAPPISSSTVAPTIGARARPRYDDGVAVVRWIGLVAGDLSVLVSPLPDVHDDETTPEEWLADKRITGPYPATDFTFDDWPEGSVTPAELAKVEADHKKGL